MIKIINKIIIFILLILQLDYVIVAGGNEGYNTDFVFLTDMIKTHHSIPYLNSDQCMLRPGQKEHGSYGIIFSRTPGFLCDNLLICYPSQLVGNNTSNGLIASIPHRLREANPNNVTQQCEIKRNQFCSEEKNKHLCKLGKPASTLWHGIMIKTDYLTNPDNLDNNIFVTTISLSISEQSYTINHAEDFNIEFGKKTELLTRVYIKDIIEDALKKDVFLGKDKELMKEFMNNINKGAYIHKYTGIWSLGLDLLPTIAQQTLDLFIYRGCACGIYAWFKTPMTPLKAVPEKSSRPKDFKNKDCFVRKTDQSLHTLGKIKEKETLVEFGMWTGYQGKGGKFLLLKGNKTFIEIKLNEDLIITNSTLFQKKNLTRKMTKNFMNSGSRLDVRIRLTKYYVWASILINQNEHFLHKFWPEKWWEGKFFNESEVYIDISGDFVIFTPVYIGQDNTEEFNEFAGIFNHIIEMPYSFEPEETVSKEVHHKFIFMIEPDASEFYIRLMHGEHDENKYIGRTVYGLYVNLTENTITTYSMDTKTSNGVTSETFNNTIFQQGKLFECVIIGKFYQFNSSFDIKINDEELIDSKIKTSLPLWMINRVSMGKDIQLLDYGVEEYQQTLMYKKKIMSLKSYGTILCFEAYVPKAKDMINNRFRINLLHDSSEPYSAFGIAVLQLTFFFAPEKYISLRENNVAFKREGKSYMEIRTQGSDEYKYFGFPETRSNPIGQTGVHINVVIYAEEFFYNISINGGDFIHYHHRIPPWAVNYVMIEGDIKDVKFEEDSNQCQKIINNSIKFELPPNMLEVKPLRDYDTIVIIGKISNFPINVTFLNGALKRHYAVGRVVLDFALSQNGIYIESRSKGWNAEKTSKLLQHHLELKKGEAIKLNFYGKMEAINFEIETKEDTYTDLFISLIPYAATHYVMVEGLEKIKEYNLIDLQRN